jgi:poly-gamma-glutamate synthesis protein (capsule biosynthesis protein)
MIKRYIIFFSAFIFGLFFGIFLGGNKTTSSNSSYFGYGSSFVESDFSQEDKKITLIAVGDILLARKVNYKMVKMNNFNWPFEKVADFLKDADFTFGNLESPLVEGCKPTETGMVFCGDKRAVLGIVSAGIDAVNLANNHSLNYGKEGLLQTKEFLSQSKIGFFGDEDVFEAEIKGVKFSFLGFNEVGLGKTSYQDLLSKVSSKVSLERQKADVVIVSFHWGEEYTTNVSARQKELAYLAIDSGADLVIGHHPHWIGVSQEYKGKKIYYSLGNFVFDQMWSEETKRGLALKFTFDGKKLVNTQEFEVKIEDFGQPYLVIKN